MKTHYLNVVKQCLELESRPNFPITQAKDQFYPGLNI